MTGQNASQDEAVLAHRLFLENGGAVPESSPARYETAAEMKERFLTYTHILVGWCVRVVF